MSTSEGPRELLALMGGPPARERADAARNRRKVLEAAAALFREHGVEAVSMDAVAARAEVGKGTLFRRFGDKSGLVAALLDEQERDLQERILSGPPPLGPGAGAAERVRAFVAAYADYLFGHLDLLRVSETASAGARYRIGAYRFWHLHLSILLAEARPEADAGYLAHALLAPLAAEHVTAVLRERDPAQIKAGLTGLAAAVTAGPVSGCS
ncbi:TetR/AcrR family transcriptional regulator [Microbispora sp. ATCC PTA-5024]|uniref:TetR/AcrR family transcriptional regulator n=1 Tax=Microbispora sp. ATCC PTA-5024 TaxID=316330 RepID=UPI0004143D17|nr:TetR/AcrR family transcriptional regulator [Microbispora sp. ATCC PTA-5024]